MLVKNNKTITIVVFKNKVISQICAFGKEILQDIIASDSCFGEGYWINDRIWNNIDCWKN